MDELQILKCGMSIDFAKCERLIHELKKEKRKKLPLLHWRGACTKQKVISQARAQERDMKMGKFCKIIIILEENYCVFPEYYKCVVSPLI